MRPGGTMSATLLGAVALLVLSGCSAEDADSKVPTREPATAAPAPTTTVPAEGTVFGPADPVRALLAESGTGRLAVLASSGEAATTMLLIDPAAAGDVPDVPAQTITLPAAGVALAQGAPGEVLIPMRDRVVRVDATTGAQSEIPVPGELRSVARADDGTLVVGAADGEVSTIAADGRVEHSLDGLVSADVVVRAGERLAVLDRRQSSVTEISPGADHLGLALRAGEGAANMIADHFGRVLVTDTADGELLVYTTGPLVLRQRFPVGSSPYALAYDRRSETVWVTCTQSNEVVGFDLSTGIPQEVGRYPTVRQPNTVTVDDRTGDLYVGSAAGEGLQRIPADRLKRGQ
ncbi:hypothetical protein IU443_01995 [Nocardia farcinica]|nr:hypothetical protein [Nocardia farcinica]MBF6260658.1 hypothetical protein [Nocardia farcinica]MBF6279672.1 hypothetical protein [Nocardia farcinica]MBF6303668.1 hypothetical protein [Nocardia farcinica]MBF6376298.1 hypothetical protein [Nocardia farcinica]